MKNITPYLLSALLLSSAAFAQTVGGTVTTAIDPTPFTLVSIDLIDDVPMADAYTYNDGGCTGANKSPTLSWSYPPEGTKSYAITMFDEDARDGDGWLHWFVTNIPATETILIRGIGSDNHPYPKGSQVVPNSWGKAEYGGPCPPVGDKPHKYTFTVYAMPAAEMAYPLNSLGWSTLDWLNDNAIAKASVTTTYQRLP
ncbi:MAG TPA: YbhB/YbcL family Raf kinase inhibitor-like protein [Alphaproteobacteria bacterium]